jgi:hypothetical protein
MCEQLQNKQFSKSLENFKVLKTLKKSFCKTSLHFQWRTSQIITKYDYKIPPSNSIWFLNLRLRLHLCSLNLAQNPLKADNIANLQGNSGWLFFRGRCVLKIRGTAVNLSWNIIVSQAYISSHSASPFLYVQRLYVCTHNFSFRYRRIC